jgi:hypothetical protein
MSSSPVPFINGIPCPIYTGEYGEAPSIVEDYSLESGPHARVIFHCDWSSRGLVVAGLLGTVNYANGTVSRTPPMKYPWNQTFFSSGSAIDSRWCCTSVPEVRGIKWQTDQDGSLTGTQLPGWGSYLDALITADFTVPLWQYVDPPQGMPLSDLSGTPYVVTKARTSGEVFSPPTGALLYDGGTFQGKPLVDVNSSQIRTRTEFSVTLVRMPIYPAVTINSLIGGVNQFSVILGGNNFPPGSILLTGAVTDPHPDPCNFGIVQDIELAFIANSPPQATVTPLDWNWFMDPTGVWVPVTLATGGPVFPYVDFSRLFSGAIT